MFKGKADFSRTQFLAGGDFFISYFGSEAIFDNARFNRDCDFVQVWFNSNTSFINVMFNSTAYFRDSRFLSDAVFSSTKFLSHADFSYAQFASNAIFIESKFSSNALFFKSKFYSTADFEEAKFASYADFNSAQFDSIANFGGTQFQSVADFEDAEFGDRVNFYSTLLPDTLKFRVKTKNVIDFTFALVDTVEGSNKRCVIDLYGTDISKLKLDYSRFDVFYDSRYKRSQLGNVYEQVLQMQKSQGFIDGYEKADKEYRHFKLTYGKSGMSKVAGHISSGIQKYWWDYGYRGGHVIYWTLGFLSIFTLINAFSFNYLNENVYTIKSLYNLDVDRKASISNYRVNRAKLFNAFFYTSLIFFGLRLNTENLQFKHRGWVVYLLLQYVLGLICIAYLANFIILS